MFVSESFSKNNLIGDAKVFNKYDVVSCVINPLTKGQNGSDTIIANRIQVVRSGIASECPQ